MAEIFLHSGIGNDANPGTHSSPKATLTGALAVAAAGDTLFFPTTHAETAAAATTYAFPGTPANPNKLLCVSDWGASPATLATGGSFSTTGANGMTINGSVLGHGAVFSAGTGASSASLALAASAGQSDLQRWDSCAFRLAAGAGGITVGTTTATAQRTVAWRNCSVKFNASAQGIRVHGCDQFTWLGGGVEAGSATPAAGLVVVGSNGRGGAVLLAGLDVAALLTTLTLFGAASIFGSALARSIKLPVGTPRLGWLVGDLSAPGMRFEAWNCDSGDTQWRLYAKDFAGQVLDEETVVRTGGGAVGSVPMSWMVASGANASRHGARIVTPWRFIRPAAAGSPSTFAADVVTDGVTLTDADAWIEVEFPGTDGFPMTVFANDAAGTLAAPVAQEASTDPWTTTGLVSPLRQRFARAVTPLEVGEVAVRVVVARPSTTVYVDLPRVL